VDAAPTRTSGDRLPSNERVGRMSSGWSTAMRKSSSKGVLTGVAFTQRGVVLGELIVEENQKEGLSLESTNSTKRV